MANLANFATATVATAPSPATSGTSLVVQSGKGVRFPATPFYATLWPDNTLPTLDNAEVVLVTARSTDTFTITRAQKSTTAQTVTTSFRISNAIYAEDVTSTTTLVTNETPGGAINGTNTAFTTASTYATGTLQVFLNGQRLKSGSGNDYVEATSGFTMQYAPVSGDVLLVDYFVTNSVFIQGTNSTIANETPTGTVNGSTTAFTVLQAKYVANSLEVFINGIQQLRGTDYTETSPSTGVFTMATAPATGDAIRVNYQFSTGASGNADTVDGYHANTTATAGQLYPLVAKTVDANGWTVYDYGLWKEYQKSVSIGTISANGYGSSATQTCPVGTTFAGLFFQFALVQGAAGQVIASITGNGTNTFGIDAHSVAGAGLSSITAHVRAITA